MWCSKGPIFERVTWRSLLWLLDQKKDICDCSLHGNHNTSNTRVCMISVYHRKSITLFLGSGRSWDVWLERLVVLMTMVWKVETLSVFSFWNTLFYLFCLKSHLGIWELDFFRFVFKFMFDKVGMDRLLEFLLNEDYYREYWWSWLQDEWGK